MKSGVQSSSQQDNCTVLGGCSVAVVWAFGWETERAGKRAAHTDRRSVSFPSFAASRTRLPMPEQRSSPLLSPPLLIEILQVVLSRLQFLVRPSTDCVRRRHKSLYIRIIAEERNANFKAIEFRAAVRYSLPFRLHLIEYEEVKKNTTKNKSK